MLKVTAPIESSASPFGFLPRMSRSAAPAVAASSRVREYRYPAHLHCLRVLRRAPAPLQSEPREAETEAKQGDGAGFGHLTHFQGKGAVVIRCPAAV